jgi:hypothetical protein
MEQLAMGTSAAGAHGSPTDRTRGTTAGRAVAAATLAFAVALLLDPAVPGKWAYMLPDGPATPTVRAVASAVSAGLLRAYSAAGMPVPFDIARSGAARLARHGD